MEQQPQPHKKTLEESIKELSDRIINDLNREDNPQA